MDKVDQLHAILSRVPTLTDEAIAAGFQFTDGGLEKLSRKLGVDRKGIDLLFAKLRTKLNGEQLSESDDDRFSYEVGFMNDVTIRDALSGHETTLSSSRGSDFLNKIEMSPDPQAVMASYLSLTEGFDDHGATLAQTGFWGRAGAGCIILARSTNRILIAHRSDLPPPYDVEQPGTWGTWGGAIDSGEDPKEAVMRELHEEAGFHGSIDEVLPLFVFKKDSFRYYNFLCVVDEEFEPHLNWENQGYRWCEPGKWPRPLHFGLAAILKDPQSMATIKKAIACNPLKEDDEPSYRVPDTFDDEISSDIGSFNFQWKVGSQHGFACARFNRKRSSQAIMILSATDQSGKAVNFKPFVNKLIDQARASIDTV